MRTTERPGVYTDYTVSGIVRGGSAGGTVGLAAAATGGTAGTVVTVTDSAAATAEFIGGNLPALAKLLLENGAAAVCCCPVVSGDYDTAFAALMGVDGIRYMVCDSHDATVHGKLLTAINGADERGKYRVGVVESDDITRSALVEDAAALNSERMVLVSHRETGTGALPGAVAAAVCGVMAGQHDPALPLNGAALTGLGATNTDFSDADLTLLVRGGVTPIEDGSIVRGITTRTTTGGVSDATWREVNTVMIVDEILPAIRDALRADFARAKNTAQTRGAIRTRVVIELENYLAREIIDSYDGVTVAPSADDGTVCVVSFSFAVAHGLNMIELSASITV